MKEKRTRLQRLAKACGPKPKIKGVECAISSRPRRRPGSARAFAWFYLPLLAVDLLVPIHPLFQFVAHACTTKELDGNRDLSYTKNDFSQQMSGDNASVSMSTSSASTSSASHPVEPVVPVVRAPLHEVDTNQTTGAPPRSPTKRSRCVSHCGAQSVRLNRVAPHMLTATPALPSRRPRSEPSEAEHEQPHQARILELEDELHKARLLVSTQHATMQRMRTELERGSFIEDATGLLERASTLFATLGFSPAEFRQAFLGPR